MRPGSLSSRVSCGEGEGKTLSLSLMAGASATVFLYSFYTFFSAFQEICAQFKSRIFMDFQLNL